MSILAYETATDFTMDDSTAPCTRNQYEPIIPLEYYDSNIAVYYAVMYSYTNRIRTYSNQQAITIEFWELYMEMITFFWSHHSVFIENTIFTKMIYDWVVEMVILADKIPQSHRGPFLDLAEKIIQHPIMKQCSVMPIF
jgi:hypothetical protein